MTELGRRAHAFGWIADTKHSYLGAQCVEEAKIQ